MANLIGFPIRHPQLKREKRALAKLIFDFCRPHDTLILPGGPARGNAESLVPAPYPATVSLRNAKISLSFLVDSSVVAP